MQVSSIAYKWDGYTKGYVDASVDDDVRSLRCMLSEKFGLPASQGLRLKCGTRDLRDGDAVSTIGGATVRVQPGGGLAGGAVNDATRDDEEARNDLSAKSKAETRDRLRTAQRPAPDCHHCHKQHHPAFG